MGSDDARRFRETQRKKALEGMEKGRTNNQYGRNRMNRNIVQFPSTYKAPSGSARRAKERAKRRKLARLKVGALILAATIGIGSLTVLGNIRDSHSNDTIQTITQLEDSGMNLDNIGLEEDTLELLQKYDEYFEDFDPDSIYGLTDNEVIEMAREIETLNFNVIKDKFVNEKREAGDDDITRSDVKLGLSFDSADGSTHTSVRIKEDSYSEREIYSNNNGIIFGIGKENSIPKEISDLIVQTEEYDDIVSDLKSDTITKKNALKKLQKLYKNISSLAVHDLSIDEKGNISLVDYSEQGKDLGIEFDD